MSLPKDTKTITKANRAAWQEAAPIHQKLNQARLEEAFKTPGYSCLKPVETRILKRLDVAGKDVAQMCCNNGRELLSAKNMGAARCVGFDGAQNFLDQGCALAKAANLDVQFEWCDAYEIPPQFHGTFDIVMITIGVLGWMPDIDGFFASVAQLLKPGGALFIHEHHPVTVMVKPGPAEAPVEWELSYFASAPYVDTNGLDYYGGTRYDALPNYSYSHKLSDILMGAVKCGLLLEDFEERPDHISNAWWNVEASDIGLPMSYTLVLRRPL
ncbi:class I SAM-dependent methyltransferase [Algirhabdus cladophorae]|uniref:class I SAM-dependent methyltransferase n=1 Tax=Algirhabdus cladophorae TaxID=3377108 RepID=UPI003B846F54